MQDRIDDKAKTGRRNFLLGATVGSAVAAAAVVAGRAPQAPIEGVVDPAPDSKGYRLTAHVRRYYRSTLV